MSLLEQGLDVSGLTLGRRVWVFASVGGNEPRNVLDLRVPFQAAGPKLLSTSADLRAILRDCGRVFENGKQSHGQVHGDFTVLGIYPAKGLHPTTVSQLLQRTENYVHAKLAGNLPALSSVSFEVEDELPTQRLEFQSWQLFGLTARTPIGSIELQVSYPDLPDGSSRKVMSGGISLEYASFAPQSPVAKRPIDEIDAFLSALLAWWTGAHYSQTQDMYAQVHARKTQLSDQPVPEYMRRVEFSGEMSYTPIGGTYNFGDSHMVITANDGEQMFLPGPTDLSYVLREFRTQLVQHVPALMA